MQNIRTDDCLYVGYFQKPHGVFGTLLLNFSEGFEAAIENTTLFLVETEGILVPWFVAEEGIRILSAKTALIDLDWVEDEAAARKLSGKKVWIPNDQIVGRGNEDPLSAWLDYAVYDDHDRFLGKIIEVNDYSGNVVFTVEKDMSHKLIPFHGDLVIRYCSDQRKVSLKIPAGLSDL